MPTAADGTDPLRGAPVVVDGLRVCSAFGAVSRHPLGPRRELSTHLARLAPRMGKLRRGPAREAKAALDELAARLDAEAPPA